jgi:3-hydroxybutyryl-CoA dehydrogenase
MEITKIGVMGAGAMGGGIAQLAAQAGYQVVLNDLEMSFVDNALSRIDAFLSVSIEKGKMTQEQKEQVMSRFVKSTDLSDFSDVDLAIEVIVEEIGRAHV